MKLLLRYFFQSEGKNYNKIPSPYESKLYKDFEYSLNNLIKAFKNKMTEEQLKNHYIVPIFKTFGYQTDVSQIDVKVKHNNSIYIVETKTVDHPDIKSLKNGNLQCQAFYETVRYYYFLSKEFYQDIKGIIITDGKHWFFMDEGKYRKHFYKNKIFDKFLGIGTLFEKDNIKAKEFDEITEEFLKKNDILMESIYFELSDDIISNEENLIKLYNFFSPSGLFKYVDKEKLSETLNKNFYSELLYLLGLKEIKQDNNLVLVNSEIKNSLFNLIETKLKKYGKKHDFETVMQLMIIWLNRILFLKVFENILIKANNFDSNYRFLNKDKIKTFADLNELFFDVLAVHEEKREDSIKKKFGDIPYLNSSLFEIHELENQFLRISDLSHDSNIKIPSLSIIKRKRKEQNVSVPEELPILEYLLEFLDYYKFYETVEEEENVINPAVLGLVFEKLNGYKDGSYYTKTEITGYMAKQSIDNYLVESLKQEGFSVQNFEELSRLFYRNVICKEKVVSILKEIKIIDPAVGSGHFLVSALDYLVYLYWLFGVIPIPVELERRFKINYENYEISIKDSYSEPTGVYHYTRTKNDEELYKFQKYLFNLKKYIIENCLFGVDVNPNSAEIARLRLWIELLKHAYYTKESNFKEMQVLPNIDINISVGNSLLDERIISKRQLSIDFDKEKFREYRRLFKDYINCSGDEKQSIKKQILKYKNEFLDTLKIPFSYMVEFPEIVDDDGNFKGFSVVLMNPPYIRQEKIKPKDYKNKLALDLFKEITNNKSSADLYVYFIKLAYDILQNSGSCWIITSNKWFRAKYGEGIRRFLKENTVIKEIVDYGSKKVFDVPTVDVAITGFIKRKPENYDNEIDVCIHKKNDLEKFKTKQSSLTKEVYVLENDKVLKLKEKIERIGKPLKDWDVNIYRGILTGLNEAFIIDSNKREEILANCRTEEERKRTEAIIKPILRGRDIKRYHYQWAGLWVIGTFPALRLNIDDYPALKKYFLDHFDIRQLEQSGKKYPELGFNARKKTGNKWFETQDQIAYYPEFEKEKIVWQGMSEKPSFCFDKDKIYTNQTAYIATGNNLKYILAVLNSNVSYFYLEKIAYSLSEGANMWIKQYVEQIPIPPITDENKSIVSQIESLVDQIHTLKSQDCSSNTSELETKIDKLIYKLYKLTPEEIEIIEQKSG